MKYAYLTLLVAFLFLFGMTSASTLFADSFTSPSSSYANWTFNNGLNPLEFPYQCDNGQYGCLYFNGTGSMYDSSIVSTSPRAGAYSNYSGAIVKNYTEFLNTNRGVNVSFDYFQPSIGGTFGLGLLFAEKGLDISNATSFYGCLFSTYLQDCSGFYFNGANFVVVTTDRRTQGSNVTSISTISFTAGNPYHVQLLAYANNTFYLKIQDKLTLGYSYNENFTFMNFTNFQISSTHNFTPNLYTFSNGAGSSHNLTAISNFRFEDFASSATSCTDGTALGVCSTANPGYFCQLNSTTLIADPNTCACGSGSTWNGTACIASSTINQEQMPIDLYVADTGRCLFGDNCPEFAIIPADRFYVRYLGNNLPITNLTAAGTLQVTNVSCNWTTYSAGTLVGTTHPLIQNSSDYSWANNPPEGDISISGSDVFIQCGSTVANSQASTVFRVQNTRFAKNIDFEANGGTTPLLTGRVNDLDNPVTYQLKSNAFYTTRPPQNNVQIGGLCSLLVGSGVYSAQNGEAFVSDIVFGEAQTVGQNIITLWRRSVSNVLNTSGEYRYSWECVPQPDARYPSVYLRSSIVSQALCANSTSSKVKASYIYPAGANTNVTNTFYYGTKITPSVVYYPKNGTELSAFSNYLCTIDIRSGLVSKGTFQYRVKNGVVNADPLNFLSETDEYLPVGNYTASYSCVNKDLLLCVAPGTLTQNISVVATPGGCAGIISSCGVSSCSACGSQTFACELGNVEVNKQCTNQACTVDVHTGADACRLAGNELYKLGFDAKPTVTCRKPYSGSVRATASGVVLDANMSSCTFQVRDTLTDDLFSTLVTNRSATDGVSFPFSFSNLPCGSNFTVSASCQSPLFVPQVKTATFSFATGADTTCNFNNTIVSQGCAYETTGQDSDKPYYCTIARTIEANSGLCGCPGGYSLNGTTCIKGTRKATADFFDLKWLNFTILIALILFVLLVLFLLKIHGALNFPQLPK